MCMMIACSRGGAHVFRPLTMPHLDGLVCGALMPRARVLPRPFEHLQMPPPRRIRARSPVPLALALAAPAQHLQMAVARGGCARAFGPRTALSGRQGVSQPLEDVHVAVHRRRRACRRPPRVSEPPRLLKRLKKAPRAASLHSSGSCRCEKPPSERAQASRATLDTWPLSWMALASNRFRYISFGSGYCAKMASRNLRQTKAVAIASAGDK